MPEISNKLDFAKSFAQLQAVPETIWGSYQFRRDILYKKISPQQQQIMLEKAIACGEAEAQKLLADYGGYSVKALYQELKIAITYGEEEQIGNRLLFALYDPDQGVLLMKKPIEKFEALATAQQLTTADITEVLLAHELFHHLESHDDSLYTQTEKIQLWQLLGYRHRSAIRALSEIAAMAFAQKLLGLDYSPYVYEVMMVWPYAQAQVAAQLRELDQIKTGQLSSES